MRYVIHDPHLGGYWKWITQRVATPQQAKIWKSLPAAVRQASAGNNNRVIPTGHPANDRRYQDLPNMVVQEYDDQWRLVATHPAPPKVIVLDTAKVTEDMFDRDPDGDPFPMSFG